ncbi:LPXTG-motif cell wall anchor domain protein [Gleimia coleocanis DSM 15436]|uniref:LPXTG-motif cell wall anchor domain protein n=1 Tax=Gleimia coleocanis DSM 15436 TaxID=525245 RepID=C0VYY2_9ACTO|nr:LPXTG cell wall anchor domain-containing protein [Gleimia coleocanis]EEH64635.1 LPXTG-motif cell wall anchor domain protein [Gleimia coleocanis DSM 15436]
MLELKIPVTEYPSCTPVGYYEVNNTAAIDYKQTKHSVRKQVYGRIKCVDVSSSVNALVNGFAADSSEVIAVVNGDRVVLTSRLENSIGEATNVPWTINLPSTLSMVDASGLRCSSPSGVGCPVDLRYNADSHTVTGTVARLPESGFVEVSFDTSVVLSEGAFKSDKVSVTAPTEGDILPEPSTSNPSSFTFGYNPKVIPLPVKPGVNDSCGVGNAAWVKPADTDQVVWELTDAVHLVAHTTLAHAFQDPKTSDLIRSYDFGVAEETNTEACVVNPPDGNTTPPGGDTKPPVKTPSVPPTVKQPTPKLANTGFTGNSLLGTTAALLVAGIAMTTYRRKNKQTN